MSVAVRRFCACPKTDARYCLEWQTKDDLRVMTGGDSELGVDEVCECSCHDDGDDDE